jgi:hypothetical protein
MEQMESFREMERKLHGFEAENSKLKLQLAQGGNTARTAQPVQYHQDPLLANLAPQPSDTSKVK